MIERRYGNLFVYSNYPQTFFNSIYRFFNYITFSL